MKNGLKFVLVIILCLAMLVAMFTPLWMFITTLILKDSLEQWYFIINLLIAGLLVILEAVGIIYACDKSRKEQPKTQSKHTDYDDFR